MPVDYTVFNWEQIIKKSDLPSNAKYIAFYLSTFMNPEQDIAWPSLKRIEHETGLTRPTILKYLSVLESEGYLTIGKKLHSGPGGEQLHNSYLITIPEKVVKEINHLVNKGGKAVLQRGLNSSSKGVKHVNPNNNRIIKNNNIIENFNFPHWEDMEGWITLGKQHNLIARPGESQNQFQNRVKRKLSD